MKKDPIIFLILITISALAISYFYYDVHEYGHFIAHKALVNANCSFNINKTEIEGGLLYQTECDFDETEFLEAKTLIAKLSGYGLEVLIASLLLLTPISVFGGVWFIRIGIRILFFENRACSDLYFLDFWAKLLIALVMVFLFMISVFIQKKWILKFVKKNRKKRNKQSKMGSFFKNV